MVSRAQPHQAPRQMFNNGPMDELQPNSQVNQAFGMSPTKAGQDAQMNSENYFSTMESLNMPHDGSQDQQYGLYYSSPNKN